MQEQLKTIREALQHGIKAINHLGGAREAMPLHDAIPVLAQLEAMVREPWLDERGYTLAPLHTVQAAQQPQAEWLIGNDAEDGAGNRQPQAEAVSPTNLIDPGTVVSFAVDRWLAEVANRPLVNKNRRTLDDTWRQVIRRFGGDPDVLLGPPHDELVTIAQQKGNQ